MDIHFTKDKRPVVCHDNNLMRLCGVDKNISDLNFNELPPLQSTIDLHFSSKQYTATESDDRKIPLLEDLMKEFPDTPFNMELKRTDQELKTEVLKLLRKYKRESYTIWGNVEEDHCNYMIRMAPDIATFTPRQVVMRLMIYFLIGYLPFYYIPYDTLQLPFYNPEYIEYRYKYSGNTLNVKIQLLALRLFNCLSRIILHHIRKRRIYVFFYTINSPEFIDEAIIKGVDGIISDAPEMLVNYVTNDKKQD